ncbi:mitochondrial distribution and morphology proteins-domain-containing protein [Cladochytrium replicatum]|nr:mitochondrial distribution and morphology proteins-domain-containing protein [Cladochytrium replicatum]
MLRLLDRLRQNLRRNAGPLAGVHAFRQECHYWVERGLPKNLQNIWPANLRNFQRIAPLRLAESITTSKLLLTKLATSRWTAVRKFTSKTRSFRSKNLWMQRPFHSAFYSRYQNLHSRVIFSRQFYTSAVRFSKSRIPTRQELLDSVTGFWPRLRLRTKLFLLGQVRPWKSDDILAMFSWIFVGHTVFVLAGTTTFFSLVLWLANSLQFQEFTAKKISEHLSAQTGWTITFESAIVPHWREGTIQLKNVSLLCTGDSHKELLRIVGKLKRSASGGNNDNDDAWIDEIDTNWTNWDVSIQSVDVTLSLWRFLEGRGLVKECTMKGVRGVVDRRHIQWDPNWKPSRREAQTGDFELDRFVIQDMLLTIYQPNMFRPYTVSIFNAELPQFRQQWLLFDIVSAESIVGMFDNCLFSVHKPHSDFIGSIPNADRPKRWEKMRHLKINGVPIDHFNTGVEGPFGWITRGTMDIDMHLFIPHTPGADILELLREEFEEIKGYAGGKLLGDPVGVATSMSTAVVVSDPKSSIEGEATAKPVDPTALFEDKHKEPKRPSILMLWDVKLNDLKASVPLVTPHISYLSNAMIRPIVAFMNANRTSIPIAFTTQMDLNNFNGAWDVYAAGFVDVLSEESGRVIASLVQDEAERSRTLKRVGIWSIQSVTKQLLAIVDYARGTRGWAAFVRQAMEEYHERMLASDRATTSAPQAALGA